MSQSVALRSRLSDRAINLQMAGLSALSFDVIIKLGHFSQFRALISSYLSSQNELILGESITQHDLEFFLTQFEKELHSSTVKKLVVQCKFDFFRRSGTQSQTTFADFFRETQENIVQENIVISQQDSSKYQKLLLFKRFSSLTIDPEVVPLQNLMLFFKDHPQLVPSKLSLDRNASDRDLHELLTQFQQIRIVNIKQQAPQCECPQVVALSLHHRFPIPQCYNNLMNLNIYTIFQISLIRFDHPCIEQIQLQACASESIQVPELCCPRLKRFEILASAKQVYTFEISTDRLKVLLENSPFLEILSVYVTGEIRINRLHGSIKQLTVKSVLKRYYQQLNDLEKMHPDVKVSAAFLLDANKYFPNLQHLNIDCFTSQIDDDVFIYLLSQTSRGFRCLRSVRLQVLFEASDVVVLKDYEKLLLEYRTNFYLTIFECDQRSSLDQVAQHTSLQKLYLDNLIISDMVALCMFSLDYHYCIRHLELKNLSHITDRFIFLLLAGTDFRPQVAFRPIQSLKHVSSVPAGLNLLKEETAFQQQLFAEGRPEQQQEQQSCSAFDVKLEEEHCSRLQLCQKDTKKVVHNLHGCGDLKFELRDSSPFCMPCYENCCQQEVSDDSVGLDISKSAASPCLFFEKPQFQSEFISASTRLSVDAIEGFSDSFSFSRVQLHSINPFTIEVSERNNSTSVYLRSSRLHSDRCVEAHESDTTCYIADFLQDERDLYQLESFSVCGCQQIDHQIVQLFSVASLRIKLVQLDVFPSYSQLQFYQEHFPNLRFVVVSKRPQLFYSGLSNVTVISTPFTCEDLITDCQVPENVNKTQSVSKIVK